LRTYLYFFVSTSCFKFCADLSAPHLPPSAHTYRLLFVKELVRHRQAYALQLAVESFCSSAAEKRDYAAFFSSRQHLSQRFKTLIFYVSHFLTPPSRRAFGVLLPFCSASSRREANYIKGFGTLASASRGTLSSPLFDLPCRTYCGTNGAHTARPLTGLFHKHD